MKLEEILRAVDTLNEEDARRVEVKASRVRWSQFALRKTARHESDDHEGNSTLVEGCYRCFPLGERVGG